MKFENKIIILLLLVSSLVIVILGRLFFLQIISHHKYKYQAQNNIKQVINLPAYRGEIFIDKGKTKVARNIASYSIYLVPQEFQYNIYLKKRRSKQREDIIQKYRDYLAKIEKEFGIPASKIDKILRKKRRVFYRLYLLKDFVEKEKIIYLSEKKEDFPGLLYQGDIKREYKDGSVYSHILGYLAKISKKELKQKYHEGFNNNSIIGKLGVERYYDLQLRGKDGYQVFVKDSKKRIRGELKEESVEPVPGDNIYLTIDSKMQNIIHKVMQNYVGGVIVSHVKTGAILGMYSYPSYDNNIFSDLQSSNNIAEYKKYINDEEKPFFNRVIQGEYPPSSTFKLLVSMAALDNNKISPYRAYDCEQYLFIGEKRFKCEGYHGPINMMGAIAHSCNTYFYKVGIDIGAKKIIRYARDYFHFGKVVDIDIGYEKPGRVPTQQWKVENRGAFWWDGDTANLSIGQGFLTTTIAQINLLTATIANNGKGCKLHLLEKSKSLISGKETKYNDRIIIELPINQEKIKKVQTAMRLVVLKGTARHSNPEKLKIAGKTGTAENIIGKQPHSWFSCYAPYEPRKLDQTIAITVFIENGGHGGSVAAPFAISILEAYFLGRDPYLAIKEKMQPRKYQEHIYQDWLSRTKQKPLSEAYIKYLENKKKKKI